MNNKHRKEIIALSLQRGVKHSQSVVKGHKVDDYAGKATVRHNSKTYVVTGRAAKWHSMAYTNGYVNITRKTISTGLR